MVQNNLKEVKKLLEKVYLEILKEFPKKSGPVPISSDDLKSRMIKPSVGKTLNASIQEWVRLNEEIEEATEKFNKSIEQKVSSQSEHYDKVYDLLKELKIEAYQVNQIIATMSKSYSRTNTKYKDIYEEALDKVNAQAKKVLRALYKKNTSVIKIPSSLTIESKKIKAIESLIKKLSNKKVIYKENVFSVIKEFVLSLTNAIFGLKNARKELQKIVAKTVQS